MKKFLAILVMFALFSVCLPLYADILPPPTAWQLLKSRPETEPAKVDIPGPKSADVSPDLDGRKKAVSPDIRSKDAGAKAPGT